MSSFPVRKRIIIAGGSLKLTPLARRASSACPGTMDAMDAGGGSCTATVGGGRQMGTRYEREAEEVAGKQRDGRRRACPNCYGPTKPVL
jgi:hypothetical protein